MGSEQIEERKSDNLFEVVQFDPAKLKEAEEQ